MDSKRQMTAPDDDIQEKYLERAIRELNDLNRRIADMPACLAGGHTPVLGSGHPVADIFLLKYAAGTSEVEEGVAFYGRAGNALMKSFKRLGIDPLVVYGTVCLKCPSSAESSISDYTAQVLEEFAIVQPKIVVAMGPDGLDTLNEMQVPLASRIEARPGEIQQLTPTVEAIYTPNIDECLDSDATKREFWAAFRKLGDWYAALPPY